jgi:hypothetical protein
MPFVAATAACDVTVPTVAHLLSCTLVWLVVVTVLWLHQARVTSAEACAGTRTWLMVIAVDVVTAARISVYSPDGAAIDDVPSGGDVEVHAVQVPHDGAPGAQKQGQVVGVGVDQAA